MVYPYGQMHHQGDSYYPCAGRRLLPFKAKGGNPTPKYSDRPPIPRHLPVAITYPAGYTADASYIYDQVNPKKPISGVKFTIPGSMATGTNLSSDTYLSVEWLPRAKKCTGDIYLAANVRPHSETFASTTYSVATSSGAAAGNIYEESVYALQGSSPCIAVRYFIHSGNIGNYPAQGEPGAVGEFDRAALLSAFDTIRASLLLGTPAPAPTTTP